MSHRFHFIVSFYRLILNTIFSGLLRLCSRVIQPSHYESTELLIGQFTTLHSYVVFYCTAIVCPGLSAIVDGSISYDPAGTAPFSYNTVATYSCNPGFSLQGSPTRTCTGDGTSVDGMFDGTAPSCARKLMAERECVI